MVSDPLANRVLYFQKTAAVIFNPANPRAMFSASRISIRRSRACSPGPHLISLDSSDQLYVADTGNNRIAVLPSVPTAGDNPAVLFSIASLSNPYGVFVDPGQRRDLGDQHRRKSSAAICERRRDDRECDAQRDADFFGPVVDGDRSVWQSGDRRRRHKSSGVLLPGDRLHHLGRRRSGPAFRERG